MTYEFEYLISTLSYAAVGRPVSKPSEAIDWRKVYSLAVNHSVIPMFAYAFGFSDIDFISEDAAASMKKQAQDIMLSAYIKKINILNMLDKLNKNAAKAIVLKGFALSSCYFVPDARISGDTDIYVGTEAEQKTLDFFTEQGFTVEKRNKYQKESKCYNAECGLIEVHAAMYDDLTKNIWFEHLTEKELIKEPYIRVETEGKYFYTLGYTDNMIYIALHLIRHFISSGMSLRQMLDVTLFYAKNKEKIDLARFWDTMTKLRYKTLINTVFSASIRYFRLPEEWMELLTEKVSADAEMMLLDDLEEGGYLGNDDAANRIDGKSMYSKAKGDEKKSYFGHKLFLLRRFFVFALPALFPTAKELKLKYSYARNHPFLLPAAWIHRLIFGGFSAIRNRKIKTEIVMNEKSMSEAGIKRMEMFKKLNMVDKD
ncbi:MAG: nucleotidyltransferase family protein [Clostridia bacterium]|nr:nucleotidyltransferase family protein [Clostridia bacterium]